MKKSLKSMWVLATFALCLFPAFGQSPNSMSYQAVIRNSSDALVTNTQIGMEINIRQGSVSGTVVYTETQTPTTNANGLVSIEIGSGADFTTIDWSAGPYFIETKTDPKGGTNYTITGTNQLLSVPYALHAKIAETVTGSILARIEALENFEPILLANGFTDSRDGNRYKVVKIGYQVWMAENLKYLPSVVGPGTGSETTPYYYVYGYNGTSVSAAKATSNYTTYGVLYNWPAAMADSASSSSNPSGVRGVCPAGWHLPSEAEWTQLINYLGGNAIAGGKLKESGTAHWDSPNTKATNETGFTALPGGLRGNNGAFSVIGYNGYWWSATEDDASGAWIRSLHYADGSANGGVQTGESINKEHGFSVRCVKD